MRILVFLGGAEVLRYDEDGMHSATTSKTEMPFTLTAASDETAHFHDARCGFSMLIPGTPRLITGATIDRSEPTYEVLIQPSELRLALRYRLSQLDAPRNAAAVIAAIAHAYAQNRCGARPAPAVVAAMPEQLQQWGVAAAASVIYPLSPPDGSGANLEEVLMLYWKGHLVTLTKRFSTTQVSAISWGLWNTASMSSIRCDIAENRSPISTLWPSSEFLQPGVSGQLTPSSEALAQRLRELTSDKPETHRDLTQRLRKLLTGREAPTHRISEDERRTYENFLGEVCTDEALRAEINAALSRVFSAHDLRGLAVLILQALSPLNTTVDALSHLAE